MNNVVFHQGIESLRVRDKRPNVYWKWRPAKKFIWLWEYIPAGFYFSLDSEPTPIEKIISCGTNVIIDNVVYKKPCIKFKMMSGSEYEKYFETFEEAKEFIENEGLTNIPHFFC